jgi:hypothetical protein
MSYVGSSRLFVRTERARNGNMGLAVFCFSRYSSVATPRDDQVVG